MRVRRMESGLRRIMRVLDANANRAGEGMRVTEDVLRFSFCEKRLSSEARRLRHAVSREVASLAPRNAMISSRDSKHDPGAKRFSSCHPRRAAMDLLTANLRRAQESARVLEECARLLGKNGLVRRLQSSRYAMYTLEKKVWARRPWERGGK